MGEQRAINDHAAGSQTQTVALAARPEEAGHSSLHRLCVNRCELAEEEDTYEEEQHENSK